MSQDEKLVDVVSNAAQDIGSFIRSQREAAQVSVRQLAEKAGVSNPYLSQIERGLRKPSADVLSQIAKALRVSAEVLYIRAGILEPSEPNEVRDVIITDTAITERQKQVLLDIYTSFCEQNRSRRNRGGRGDDDLTETKTNRCCLDKPNDEVKSVKGTIDMAKKTQKNAAAQPTVDDLKAPLLAAVGAADLALERVNEIVATLRERAGEARTDAEARVEESRARLTRLQEDLPTQFGDLRDRLSSEELRKFAESYAETAQTTYNKLVERGEVAIEKLRSQPALEEAAGRVRSNTDQAVELTQEALGNVASQTRAVGERAAKLVGVELPKKAQKSAAPVKKAAKKAPAKKAPAKKAPAKKVTQK